MQKENMSSLERVLASINNKEVDRLPVINPTSVATIDSCKVADVLFCETHLNADKMATLASVSHDLLGFDSVMPHFSVVQEAAAFGAEINWGTDADMPNHRSKLFDEPDQFKLPSDFLDRLPIKTVIDAIKLLRKKYGKSVAIIGKVMGPWTLSYNLYGVERFLMDTIEEPEKVDAFLDKFKEISLTFAEAQFEAGADLVTWADHATADLVSADSYRRFLLPIHKEINKKLKGRPIILHCCGYTLDRISSFEEAGFPIFHFDSRNDIGKAITAAGDMKLAGCVNNMEVLLKGTVKDVETQVENIIESGIRIISPECAIPLNVKNENLKAIGDTVKKCSNLL